MPWGALIRRNLAVRYELAKTDEPRLEARPAIEETDGVEAAKLRSPGSG